MRTLAIAIVVLGLAGSARADTALGIFVGEPTGLDIKLGLQNRGALDILIGADSLEKGRVSYGHLTYLYTLAVARGNSVNVPLRLGIGGWVAGIDEDVTAVGARVPFEIALKFHRTPLEIYGEIAFVLRLIQTNNGSNDDIDSDIDGGIGLRVYF